jgi:mono/diheme cytochrome c family protein
LRTQLIAAALGGGFVLGLLQLDVLQTQARAQTQLERGSYLVNTIMACGNCHSPRDAQGKLTADNALSGGLKFVTPAFVATAPNITPDPETGLGTWTDEDIKHALIEGLRPIRGNWPEFPWLR